MSSPAAGYEMLLKRKSKLSENEEIGEDEVRDNPIVERWDEQNDTEQIEIIDRAELSDTEWNTLNRLAQKALELTKIENIDHLITSSYNPRCNGSVERY
jgi:oligoribonuclease NrnB/cAMP/cGMP phosphodiesterase (DHH superfamily)